MCGFLFNFSFKEELNNTNKEFFTSNFNTIIHRGPDEKDFIFNKKYMVGSCRLKIFDLVNGKMPLYDATKRYFIVYNGEIYNFKELKEKYKIKTISNSDTEVLLNLYIDLGENFLNELNGMYSFIIYDTKKNTFFCARDRIGIKPFYYLVENDEIHISSEIKPLIRNNSINLNKKIIKRYLYTSYYDYGNETFFNKIFQLEPGHFMKFDHDHGLVIKKYWNPIDNKKQQSRNNNYDIQLDYLLEKAFNYQIQSDTKVGINVSEGVDSLCMLEYLNKVNKGQGNISANNFFYSEFGKPKNLLEYEKKNNWKINYFEIKPDDIIKNFEDVFKMNDGPFPGFVTISKYLLIKRAYDNETKVILEAQGGDDIFGGYKQYFASFFYDKLQKMNFFSALKDFQSFKKKEKMGYLELINWIYMVIKNSDYGGISHDGTKNNYFFKKDKTNISKELLGNIYFSSEYSKLKKIIFRDIFFTKLQRILKSCDRCSMASSKELRVPLLDHKIVKLGLDNIDKYFFYNGNIRYKYREILSNKFKNRNFLIPKNYVDDPQTKWMKGILFDWCYSLIDSKKNKNDFYDIKDILKDFERFRKDTSINNSNYFWRIICINKLLEYSN